ncbi:MAG: hypothetical protein HYX68_06150 [Planctomycetes bacterium]|jgi:hypothetical protein|nr:hypothetical protein [Planctomycetota bacterium]
MKAHVLTGSKSEIAARVARMEGNIREVIVFIEEPADGTLPPSIADLFAEMEPYVAQAGGADYSRESIYMPTEGK